ncbi:hypothetical protein [Cyanobium sp. PCC 7001]|uniref:hypothetical protein n=1 Tax=Cyanobium sp. PCC 7001 TaxID=180281 RepID=UPI0012EABDA5|nr:hypothetical protein [Cyanobium sp. PCC 7001]
MTTSWRYAAPARPQFNVDQFDTDGNLIPKPVAPLPWTSGLDDELDWKGHAQTPMLRLIPSTPAPFPPGHAFTAALGRLTYVPSLVEAAKTYHSAVSPEYSNRWCDWTGVRCEVIDREVADVAWVQLPAPGVRIAAHRAGTTELVIEVGEYVHRYGLNVN